MFTFLKRKGRNHVKVAVKALPDGDFLSLIREDPKYFADMEYSVTHKPHEEILKEIHLGLRLNNVNFSESLSNRSSIVLIPPKYEFWSYFLLAVRFALLGYKTTFLYHNWANEIVEKIKPSLSYLKYQYLSLEKAEDFAVSLHENIQILNFAESFRGVQSNIPAFSTAVVDKDSDIDYVVAYILTTAFSFAGMKKSNLKRIIIEESLKDIFVTKLLRRLTALDDFNTSKIKSARLKSQIHEIISDAISEGADLLIGGDDFDRDNYRNIILDNVTREMRIFQKKFYGPVLLLSYTSFEPRELAKVVTQQPSKGLVVFTNNDRFADLHHISLRNNAYVLRPLRSETKLSNIIEYNPSLEVMFKDLGIEE